VRSLSHRIRGVHARLMIVVLVSVTIGLVGATLAFNLLLTHTTTNNVDTLLRQRVESERALLTVRNGRVIAGERNALDTAADSRIWIYQGTKPIELPPAEPTTQKTAEELVRSHAEFVDVRATDERLYAVPLLDDNGRRVGTIIAGVSVAPYEETRRAAVVGSLVFAAILLCLVAGSAWWLLRSALKPVAEMTEQAAAWSEHDLDRRFEVVEEPYDELTQLAATLNGLLDRLAASLRHERRFSAELSHELRTPLSKVIAEAEIALRRERSTGEYREALGVTLRNAQHLARIVETLVAVAQHEASAVRGTSDAYEIVEQAAHAVVTVADSRHVAIVTEPPPAPVRIGVDGDLAERVLQPIIDNACRYARSEVRVVVEPRPNRVRFVITDDGDGVDPSDQETIFEPGSRGTNSTGLSGAGLGLALARRLAHAASGDVTYESNGRGARFVVSLPTA
jgi:signal transduction histidine kinase